MKHYIDQVRTTAGIAVPAAAVAVYLAGTNTLASLFSDDGVTSMANPTATATDGTFKFYIADGRYDIKATFGSTTLSSLDVEIADILERNTGDTNAVLGSVTLTGLNSRILVDGTKYPLTAAGVQSAINDAQTSGAREVWLPAGAININTTLTITHGGFKLKGCGAGLTDSGSTAATSLVWTGAAGSDLLQIAGASNARLDRVVLEDMLLDGAGTARYVLRAEKIDSSELHGVRLRPGGGTTIGMYTVDATGWKLYNSWFSQCASYCLVSDWGTGGFYWAGGGVDVLLASSNPAVLVQGATNAWHMTGIEMDSPAGQAFAGFVQTNGFDTNSSFASAPTGGAGAPIAVTIDNSSFFIKAASGAPSQGAEIFIAGTASNPTQKAVLDKLYFFGGSGGISAAAVKVDRASQVVMKDCFSTGHVTSTLVTTANTATPSMQFVVSNDPARCTGVNCGLLLDLTVDSVAGRLASLSGFVPASAGAAFIGSRLLPFSDVFIGGAAANNIDLTGTATGSRTATFPDNTGVVAELNLAQSWTADQTFTTQFLTQSANAAQWIRGQASELLTLSTSGATTDTAANLLPANSIIEAVTARIITTITTATDWKLGDATQAARFTAANSTLTAGTTAIGLNHVDPTVASSNLGPVQASAAKVRVTTTGTPGAGAIRITVFYRQFVAPTS